MSNIASPFSTGGGGSNYEAQVGAYYLTTLLAQSVPRGQKAGKTIEVRFQRLFEGEPLDDLVIISELPAGKAKLALQIKRDLSFGSKSTTFDEVLYACWKTLKSSQFNIGIDRFGIAVGLYSKKIDEHYQSVLEWADTSASSADFFNRVNQQNLSNQEQRSFIGLIRSKLDCYLGSSIANAELWDFLRSMVILHFDFQKNSSRDWTHSVQDINHLLSPEQKAASPQIFSELVQIAERAKRTAGSFNVDTLRKELQNKGIKLQTPQQSQTQLPDRLSTDISNKQVQETDWQQICRDMLERQIRFPTLNDLMAKDGVSIDPVKLFVPVGLVERKQKRYQRADIDSAQQGSQLLQPLEEEVIKRFDREEDFFDQVIANSDISNGSRLVITGEPGAGKTTLLQKIGERLLLEEMFPVWVSLGKEGVPPTYEFLSRVLKENARTQAVELSEWEKMINFLLQTGKVWLLLDGADELIVGGSPLQVIGKQLRETWASQVRVVLTCRLNAWDSQALPEFRVFRTLEFDYQKPVDGYSNQVEAYIHRFFTKDRADPQLGESLIQELCIPGKERIRDSIKNPLRLALLCYVWETGVGSLPDTRAELYQLFVDHYYDLQELKYPEVNIDRTERDLLNLALGEIAKTAFDSVESRFRLKRSLIESIPEIGKSDTKSSLFNKAIQLGWLNYIGTTVEKPCEDVYAFFHSTFQEYFAALAIDDWHSFLNHIPYNPDMGSYRIFEKHWTEVILFWIARVAPDMNLQKEAFIENLINFKDCCDGNNFYGYRAYFLASYVISEYPRCKYTDEIIKNIFKLGFGNVAKELHYCIEDAAREALEKTESSRVVALLSKTISDAKEHTLTIGSETFYLRSNADHVDEAAYILTKIEPENKLAITTLTEREKLIAAIGTALLDMNQEEVSSFAKFMVWKTPFQGRPRDIVIEVTPDGEKVIESLKNFKSLKKRNIYGKCIKLLKKETLQEAEIVKSFIQLLCGNDDVTTCSKAIFEFKKISPDEILVKEVVKGIKNYFCNLRAGSEKFFLCYGVLWYCAQNMSYPDFFDAWHSSSSIGAKSSTE